MAGQADSGGGPGCAIELMKPKVGGCRAGVGWQSTWQMGMVQRQAQAVVCRWLAAGRSKGLNERQQGGTVVWWEGEQRGMLRYRPAGGVAAACSQQGETSGWNNRGKGGMGIRRPAGVGAQEATGAPGWGCGAAGPPEGFAQPATEGGPAAREKCNQ